MRDMLDGPIPGENFTSDTKNYPWHRPPELTSYNDAIEYSINKLTSEETSRKILAFVEVGMPIVFATDLFVTQGISKGKWTPDFAILIAGPVARCIELMAKAAEIDYEMGLEPKQPPVTAEYLKAIMEESKAAEVDEDQLADAVEAVEGVEDSILAEGVPEGAGGLMAPQNDDMGLTEGVASLDEQDSMLGHGLTDEVEAEEEEVLV